MNYFNNNNNYFKNPILPGFYPDPSICRVGEDYYLVTSSFAYYPGVPIFHSKDLVHWEQIGHVLDRPSQLDIEKVEQSRGIFAPTIRYYNGTFYMITTNVSTGGNFIVTAKDPAGPWSDPYWLDAPGIDPSLFFDEDGRAYYVGTRPAPEGEKYYGNWEIWLQELDLNTMKLVGETYSLWRGSMRDVDWPEGPHIYKINGLYYLMISEAGTGHEHAITIARSENILGPYQGYKGNPILTHRHLGRNYPIVNVGHGDLVETQNGEWWMVLLASRPYGGYYRNLGRETFLVPVTWENGWPLVSPGTGKVEDTYPVPNLPQKIYGAKANCDNFEGKKLGLVWNTIQTPKVEFYSLTQKPGYLSLKLSPYPITGLEAPSFVGRRQQHINFAAFTAMEFEPQSEGEEAGLVLYQNRRFNFRFTYILNNGKKLVKLVKCSNGLEETLAEKEPSSAKLYLKIEANGQAYSFSFGETCDDYTVLADSVDGRILSTDVAGGFVGAYIGLYACSNGKDSENYACFDWFEYHEL
ncbi:glycoside hydrolase family 43 protein [Clostridium thermarum]|uniref:glycoside hydrolase family 43 protein n=1 Tax=Clostridium thermarum TaxID=1716543 RepID=UPI001123D066|nr:glycoside hydrolase family 43 protein [Clostridium thermarum]